MATKETDDYVNFRSAAVPFTDPMPALKTIGYLGSKAQLVSGYGASESDAIQGLLLVGREMIPDCGYTQYGVDTSHSDGGFYLTSVVLAAP